METTPENIALMWILMGIYVGLNWWVYKREYKDESKKKRME